MKKIDFNKEKPYFTNGEIKWYVDNHFQEHIGNKQAYNLPKLSNLFCFIVIGEDIEDYVLIDNKQNVIASYPYTFNGYEQMEAKIKIFKISKHFDKHEKVNV